MTSRLLLALALALASAGALNWGFYRQHGEASALPPLSVTRPFHSLRILFASRRWLTGFLVGILGWVFYVVALGFGPLSLVQAASAGGIGILALLVRRFGGIALVSREWLGVLVSVGGLVLLGLSLIGRGGNAHHWGSHGSWLAIAAWLVGSGALAACFAGPARRLVVAGAGLGIGAGFLYAAGDVATKAAVAGGWRLLFVPALLAAHGLGFVLLQLGFQRGAALATAGVATLFTNATPIAAGMALFHEPLPGGPRGALRVLAFAAVVAGAALLTRSAEPEGTPASTEPRLRSGPARRRGGPGTTRRAGARRGSRPLRFRAAQECGAGHEDRERGRLQPAPRPRWKLLPEEDEARDDRQRVRREGGEAGPGERVGVLEGSLEHARSERVADDE